MRSFFVERKGLRCTIAVLVLLYTTNVSVHAQDDGDGGGLVSNVRVDKQGNDNIFIEYDLAGAVEDLFTVSLLVRLQSDSTYTYTPINIIGDVGTNIRPGKNKRISWRISDEYISLFDREDVVYDVRAVPLSDGGIGSELYIAGGAAVVGLALAIVLLSSNKTGENQATNIFPLPPARP